MGNIYMHAHPYGKFKILSKFVYSGILQYDNEMK